jgi:hypothetical protein
MKDRIDPWVRVAIMLIAACTLGLIAYRITGSILPNGTTEALIFQNALLFIVLGSALLEHHYTKPADSVVNSLMGLLSLLTVYSEAPPVPWIIVTSYCAMVFLLSVACVSVSAGAHVQGWRKRVSDFTYRPSVVFGRSRVLFTIVFLSGLWFFYSIQDQITLSLVVFWGVFLAIWPLKIPEIITAWFSGSNPGGESIGEIIRIDNPNILRVRLAAEARWDPGEPQIGILPDGESFWVQPLYSQFQDGDLLATGLLTSLVASGAEKHKNCVLQPKENQSSPSTEEINENLGGGSSSELIGYVVEQSEIGVVRFETISPHRCHGGMLVWAELRGERVYYQISAGTTHEESFAADKHGFQVASASQLGVLGEEKGFSKFEWLPGMNTPVFSSQNEKAVSIPAIKQGDFELGVIPNSKIRVGGNFTTDYNYHTALLGVTGAGKTELAFDMIRHALDDGIKVICIDLTAQYAERLQDLSPSDLSINAATSAELSKKLFDIETTAYGAPDEKKALSGFADKLRTDIAARVKAFLEDDSGSGLGLILLEEISNTKATLWITELYMTCMLNYARENMDDSPRVLIVVEEAHTVMPEANAMGLGDFDSKGLVAKIAQIALQGRKYGVGLLVLAQRTATVSKTVLTQCNTIISFACYDDTSLSFLRNIYGKDHVALIPNLPRLHAIAFGKWIRSEHPIVFQIPFDDEKASRS